MSNERDEKAVPSRSVSEQCDNDRIAQNLKRVYDEVAKEPLPDQLQSLLERLKSTSPG